ncbi:MAG: AAA family ATPase [Halobacteria archaeon]|nr:AAA family ATPase [Halobacteria archaeon]
MYLKHFDLSERPFSITPDPRFLYMSSRHREALAHLLYGLGEGGGFVQLTGEVGTGKTTLCRCLIEQVPDNVDVALVLNPKLTAEELIATVCDELGVEYPPEIHSIKTLTDILNRHLLDAHARGRRTVLIIDEAQNLSAEVLEQVRLLTNLETPTQKLLQIILIGQPELRDLLARDDMRQLAQRVTARYHLEPINREETEAYIQHRLQISGVTTDVFNTAALDHIQRLSGGIPRLINVLCDRSMLGAYAEGKLKIDKRIVKKAAQELLAEDTSVSGGRRWLPLALVGFAIAAIAVVYYRPWQPVDISAALHADAEVMSFVERHPGPDSLPPARPALAPAAAGIPAIATPPQPEDDGNPQGESLTALLLNADKSYYRDAWTALFAQWSVELPAHVKPDFCNFATENGLRCLLGKGTWASLRHFDRPVILTLVATDGQRVPVTLQHLDQDSAELVLGGELYRLPVGQLDSHWYGDFAMLIQAPPAGTLYMRVGSRGADIGWLRQQLETIQGVDLSTDNPLYFDDGLHQQLLAFQRSRGLVPDGVVGPHTIIQLNSFSQQSGKPRLTGGIS